MPWVKRKGTQRPVSNDPQSLVEFPADMIKGKLLIQNLGSSLPLRVVLGGSDIDKDAMAIDAATTLPREFEFSIDPGFTLIIDDPPSGHVLVVCDSAQTTRN